MRLRDFPPLRLPLWILSVRMVLASGQAAWVNRLRQVAAPARAMMQ
jgi:hypothetical protein